MVTVSVVDATSFPNVAVIFPVPETAPDAQKRRSHRSRRARRDRATTSPRLARVRFSDQS